MYTFEHVRHESTSWLNIESWNSWPLKRLALHVKSKMLNLKYHFCRQRIHNVLLGSLFNESFEVAHCCARKSQSIFMAKRDKSKSSREMTFTALQPAGRINRRMLDMNYNLKHDVLNQKTARAKHQWKRFHMIGRNWVFGFKLVLWTRQFCNLPEFYCAVMNQINGNCIERDFGST